MSDSTCEARKQVITHIFATPLANLLQRGNYTVMILCRRGRGK